MLWSTHYSPGSTLCEAALGFFGLEFFGPDNPSHRAQKSNAINQPFLFGDRQWKIYRLKNGDWLQVFLVPVPLFQRLSSRRLEIEEREFEEPRHGSAHPFWGVTD